MEFTQLPWQNFTPLDLNKNGARMFARSFGLRSFVGGDNDANTFISLSLLLAPMASPRRSTRSRSRRRSEPPSRFALVNALPIEIMRRSFVLIHWESSEDGHAVVSIVRSIVGAPSAIRASKPSHK